MYSEIREIKMSPNIRAHVHTDGDDDMMLGIFIYDEEYSSTNHVTHFEFNINWIEDEQRVDWLTQVIGRNLSNAYYTGKNNKRNEVSSALKYLFNTIGKNL